MKEYINRESSTRGLWYEKKFRDFIKENKHLPKEVIGLAETIREKGEKKCVEGVCLECIDLNVKDEVLMGLKEMKEEDIYSISFKVTINDKNFFLKIEKGYIETDGGYEEMQDTILAKDVIDSLNNKNVRVVNPLLGYSNNNNTSYYIAEWENLPVLENLLNDYEKKGLNDEAEKIHNRIEEIRGKLDGYREVSSNNMLYDKGKDQIVLFDMHL